MEISVCNRIEGVVGEMKKGKATTNVRFRTDIGELTLVVTSSAIEALALEPGDRAIAMFREAGARAPRAVIPVDRFGHPADYRALAPICAREALLMLCDAAQGFGGALDGKVAGAMGDAAATSFFPAGRFNTLPPVLYLRETAHARVNGPIRALGRAAQGTAKDSLACLRRLMRSVKLHTARAGRQGYLNFVSHFVQ